MGYGANQINITIIGFFMTVGTIIVIRRSSFKADKSNVMYLTVRNKLKAKLDVEKIFKTLEKNSVDVDLKRLDENLSINEASFIITFQNKQQLLKLREELSKIDNKLELIFLDNTKIF